MTEDQPQPDTTNDGSGDVEPVTTTQTATPAPKPDAAPAEAKPAQKQSAKKSLIGQAAAAKADADKKQGDTADAAPKRAPERYEFKAPDGRNYDPETLQAYEGVARDLDLSNEDAQKMLGTMAEALSHRQQAHNEAQQTAWQEAIRNHPTLGGDNLAKSQELVARAASIGPPGFRELLEGPLGDEPNVFEFLVAVGQYVSPDSQPGSGAPVFQGNKPKDRMTYDEQAVEMYPNQA